MIEFSLCIIGSVSSMIWPYNLIMYDTLEEGSRMDWLKCCGREYQQMS